MDASRSMRSSRFVKVTEFVTSLLGQLQITPDDTRVAVVTYSDTATVHLNLSTLADQQAIAEHVRRLEYIGGKSNMREALRVMVGTHSAFLAV